MINIIFENGDIRYSKRGCEIRSRWRTVVSLELTIESGLKLNLKKVTADRIIASCIHLK